MQQSAQHDGQLICTDQRGQQSLEAKDGAFPLPSEKMVSAKANSCRAPTR